MIYTCFPHVHVSIGFKTSKFKKYDGHGDPLAHLKRYCNQVRAGGNKEELLIAYFKENLMRIVSEWFIDQDNLTSIHGMICLDFLFNNFNITLT